MQLAQHAVRTYGREGTDPFQAHKGMGERIPKRAEDSGKTRCVSEFAHHDEGVCTD